MTQGPFHAGERLVQEQLGEADIARRVGQSVGDRIPDAALDFVARQRMVVLTSVDAAGRPWSSLLLGEPGFASAPEPGTLEIDLSQATCPAEDPLWPNLETDARVGTLVIDLATRRRLRVNGRATMSAPRGLRIAVDEAYANCPKYIQRRTVTAGDRDPSFRPAPARRGERLEASHRSWIEAADTLFVASAHPRRGADASHRGGNPGFIQVLDHRTLRLPDYRGNSMYNTLGNFAVNPAAGLLLVDFERPATLQLSGRAGALLHLDRPEAETGGTRRYWDFAVESWIESELAPVLRWELLDRSPFNPQGGER